MKFTLRTTLPMFWALLLAIPLLCVSGCSHAPVATTPLKVGIIPYDKAAVVEEDYGQFADYLGTHSGRPSGQVFVTPEYAGILTALRADQIDCAFLNPLSYVIAVQEYRSTPEHMLPLAMPYFQGSLTYRGIIFVRADSPIKTLAQLRGKSVAFNDQTSTSGYLYPSRLLLKAGIDPSKDIKAENISGIGPVLAVLNHSADAGAGLPMKIRRKWISRKSSNFGFWPIRSQSRTA
jgi:phosphonate transport system substrate-binding protein